MLKDSNWKKHITCCLFAIIALSGSISSKWIILENVSLVTQLAGFIVTKIWLILETGEINSLILFSDILEVLFSPEKTTP